MANGSNSGFTVAVVDNMAGVAGTLEGKEITSFAKISRNNNHNILKNLKVEYFLINGFM